MALAEIEPSPGNTGKTGHPRADHEVLLLPLRAPADQTKLTFLMAMVSKSKAHLYSFFCITAADIPMAKASHIVTPNIIGARQYLHSRK